MFSFGTDGYRAIVGDGFDFETVGKLTYALCQTLKNESSKPKIIIGYDTRFLSDKFAKYAAQIAVYEGLDVKLTESYVPTPMLSHAVVDHKADAGIVITASHNPYAYNGFKVKNYQGGSASPEQISALEPYLEKDIKLEPNKFHASPDCEIINPAPNYVSHLDKILNKDLLKKSNFKVIVDPLYGAGMGYFKNILEKYNFEVTEIHNQINPSFGGLQPEPIGENLNDLRDAVLKENAEIGLALDGDADRSGVIDKKGNFVNSHQIFALLLYHLVKNKKQSGLVVKTFSTTSLIDAMVREYDLEIKQTPIGFKHISNLMLTEDVLIGGEESGGIGIRGHLPERDGIFIGLMLTELIIESGKSIDELIEMLYSKFGNFAYDRIDKIIDPKIKTTFYSKIDEDVITKTTNKKIINIYDADGQKFEFSDNSWLMFRLSGTESVARIYAEAANDEEVTNLLSAGVELIENLTNNC